MSKSGQYPENLPLTASQKAALLAESFNFERPEGLEDPGKTSFITDPEVRKAVIKLFDRMESEQEKADEKDEGLSAIKTQYDALAENIMTRCTWEELQKRLLADNKYFLHLAKAMVGGGILFGVDKSGNPLFADAGDEPFVTDMTYPNAHNSISTGYEMFPYSGEFDKSEEIEMFEAATGRFITQFGDDQHQSIWLESGTEMGPGTARNPIFHRAAGFATRSGGTEIHYGMHGEIHAVRRLLRVKQM